MSVVSRSSSPIRLLAVGTVLCALFAGSASAHAASTNELIVTGPTNKVSYSVRVLAPTAARKSPSRTAKSVMLIPPVAPLGGAGTVLLVLERRVVNDEEWLRLMLPKRPNGSSGWVLTDNLRFLQANPMRIVIDQSDRKTYVYRSGKLVYTAHNAVGTASTPTPMGRFAIAEEIPAPPNGFLGPWVLPTTGFSETLNEYAGGNGRFAMHGTSVPALIGTRASHGCIRHRNGAISRISALVRVGTPLLIRP